SVVSHAKSLNYTPRSFVSSSANVTITISPTSSTNYVVIPKGTTFSSRVGSNTFTFTTNESLVLSNPNNNIFTSNITLYEGNYITDSFVMNYSNTSQRFVMSNPTIDTESLNVTVIEDNGDLTVSYTKVTSLIGMTSASNSYFIEAAENQQYELRFGDNVFGRRPKDGSVIIANYRTSSGELPNGASTFTNDGNIDGHSNVSLYTISNASGGAINESIESIRYNAPRAFQTQNRAVTASDYETILKANFSDIQSISAYGGENLVPPQFGKVFISVDVINADGTPQNRIDSFSSFIKDKTPLSIDVVFVDPDFLYVDVVTEVKYNVNLTSKLSNDIKTSVLSKISSYNLYYLDGFKKTLYYSKLVKEIDSADPSIVSNDTEIRAIKKITPTLNTNLSYEIDFGFKLKKETGVDLRTEERHYGHTIQSSVFTFNGYRAIIIDDTVGALYVAKLTSNVIDIERKIGTIDYENGIIIINNLNVSSFEGSAIKIYAVPNDKDFSSNKNVILSIADEDIKVTVIPVKI
ncbi:hypothetical protein EB077_10305, partial [bacterium]|nr:hypothetical protein [bacterium]